MPSTESTRLNKYIAQHLAIGRRAADELIAHGKVTINNNKPALGARVQLGDMVVVNGAPIAAGHPPDFLYVIIDKPTGYVCSRRQQGETPTIYDMLPAQYHHLKPVGRLDKDSSGLLLLTNDGDLAHTLTHPSFSKIKRYEVSLQAPLAPLHRQMIADHGIQLPDGTSKLELERLHDGDDSHWLVTMHEGRNRQIRRTFAALGYTVQALRRIQFGRLTLSQLEGQRITAIPKSAIA